MFACKCRIHNLQFSICCIIVVVVFTRPSGSVIYEKRELYRSSIAVSTDSSCFGAVTIQINTLHLLCSFHCWHCQQFISGACSELLSGRQRMQLLVIRL